MAALLLRSLPSVVLACAFAAVPSVAATRYDPAADGIDRVCNAFVPAAAPRDLVELARVDTHDGSVPNWRRSDAATNARLQRAPELDGGDFATIVFDRGSIVFADTVHVDARATGTQTRAWCFIGGKLSRATVENFDATSDLGWRRTLYYGDDLEKPLSDYVLTVTSRGVADRRAKPPLDLLTIDAFGTPAKLPFYDAAVAGHAGTKKRS